MRYLTKTLNYLERITISNLTHMMSMVDLMVIGVETLRINNGCSLQKEFTELTHMNPLIVLCQNINQVYLYHDCVRDPLTCETKDIIWMGDHVLTMTYKSLAIRFPKCHRLGTT